jgi:hypothetical protein
MARFLLDDSRPWSREGVPVSARSFFACLFLAALAVVRPAGAVLVDYGSAVDISYRDCTGITPPDSCRVGSVFGPNPVQPVSNVVAFPNDGGLLSGASVTQTETNVGTASASVSFGAGDTPTIRMEASSDPDGRIVASAFGIQGYTYTGTIPLTVTFGGLITYTQSGGSFAPGQDPAGLGRFVAGLYLLDPSYDPTSLFTGPVASLAFNADAGFSASQLASDRATSDGSTSGPLLLQITRTLNPGDELYVAAWMQGTATRGGWFDSANTFRTLLLDSPDPLLDPASLLAALESDPETSFFTGEGLLSAREAREVPEPATAALLLTGLGSVAWARRRRRRDRA